MPARTGALTIRRVWARHIAAPFPMAIAPRCERQHLRIANPIAPECALI
jgi:hypothetical protein